MLPDDIAERLAEALKPFGYQAPVERSHPVGESDGTWREINDKRSRTSTHGFRISALTPSAMAHRGARRRNGATATA